MGIIPFEILDNEARKDGAFVLSAYTIAKTGA